MGGSFLTNEYYLKGNSLVNIYSAEMEGTTIMGTETDIENKPKPSPSALAIRVGKNIKRLREARGLDQSEMGRRLGKSANNINNMEAGRKKPSLKYIEDVLMPFFNADAIEFFVPRQE
jgi:ribosome-binding protein aMBF1 (putative translation factor)